MGTVLPLAPAYFAYNYLTNSAMAGHKPGMEKEEGKTQKLY